MQILLFSYRLENITPIGQNKALRGEIEIVMEPYFYISNHIDSIRYEILLIDKFESQ